MILNRSLIAVAFLLLFMSKLYAQPQPARGIDIVVKTQDGKSIPLYNESYALVIGVRDYSNGWPDLPNAVRDAMEVKSELEKHNFSVTNLQNPTSPQLETGIKNFLATYGLDPNNRLLFYFAGHGHTIKKRTGVDVGYIVPSDAPLPSVNPAGFMRRAISMENFNTYARNIDAKHALFIFDSCFSGSIFALSRAIPAAISYNTSRPVRQFITAGDENEQVPDESIFKEQFIAALNGEADVNKDKYITGTELGTFLHDKVINYSRNSQHPQYGKIKDPKLDKGDFVFVLTRQPFWGILHVRTKPWCHVLLDGKEICTSPYIYKNVSPGSHEIRLKRDGFRDIVKRIKITNDNSTIRVDKRLVKE